MILHVDTLTLAYKILGEKGMDGGGSKKNVVFRKVGKSIKSPLS